MTISYLSLGSNIGDRFENLEICVSEISKIYGIEFVKSSSFYETQPWGVENQPWFLNAVIEIETTLLPDELLIECNKIEMAMGRNRDLETRWGERIIDIDILFYGSEIICKQNLVIPHKFLHKRAFVLVPMMEIAPDFVHPFFNKTIEDLYNEIEHPEDVFLYGTV